MEQEKFETENCGFRVMGNTKCIYIFIEEKLSYLYPKRKVKEDGIHIAPLDIQLINFSFFIIKLIL